MRFKALIIILCSSLLISSLYASPKKDITYGDIEEAIINADFDYMNYLASYLEQVRTNTPEDQYSNRISLNEALGLVYLHLGYRQKSYELFNENHAILLKFSSGDKTALFRTMSEIMLSSDDKTDTYARFIDNIGTDSKSSYAKLFKGLQFRQLQHDEEALSEFQEAEVLCDEYAAQSIRWARIFSLIIKEHIIRIHINCGEYNKALDSIKYFQSQIRLTYGMETYYDIILELDKAKVYILLGNYTKAEQSINSSVLSLENKKGEASTLYEAAVELSGDMAFDKAEYMVAQQFYVKAESILENRSLLTIPILIKQLNCLYKMKKEEEAETLEIRIDEWLDNNDHLQYFTDFIFVKGESFSKSLLNTMAIDLLHSTLELTQNTPIDYDNKLRLQNSLGNAYFYSGDYDKAVNLYSEIIINERKRAHDLFAFLPESQREIYWKNREPLMNNIFMLNREGTITISRGTVFEDKKNNRNISSSLLYDTSLLNKGLLLEAFLNMHRTIMSSQDKELINAFNELRKLKGSDPMKAEHLENIIRSKIGSYGDYMDFTEITWKDVRDNLALNETAIEFVVSEDDNVEYYSAEVLRRDYSSPQHVFLFARKKEDTSLSGMKPYESNRLYNKVWGKLGTHLKGCTDVYFSPAGILYGIALEYLPVNDTTYANDIYCFHRLSSTKSIVKRTDEKSTMKSAALYGGLDYNLDEESMEYYAYTIKDYESGNHKRSLSNSTTLENINWQYLYGTAKEINNISNILHDKQYSISTYTGGEGIEESFKILNGNSPEIIHIATHGFFIRQSPDILLSTGLVFAGANNYNVTISSSDNTLEDGLLTSKEISEMDLNRTELVVLSACHTGLGEVSQEGVFGLQRGFKKACAKTLLMSLWEVEDEATNQLMTSFYSHLAAGKDKSQALYLAQTHVKEKCGESPHLWAGFILLD